MMRTINTIFTIIMLSTFTNASNNWAPIIMGEITTFVPYKQATLCKTGYRLLYTISTLHPYADIDSTSNKVKIIKSCWNGKHIMTLSTDIIGSFTNRPNKYTIYYSSSDKPPYGYSKLDYYSGTQYNGLYERYMYASRTKSELITKVTNDINNQECKRYADNTRGGNLDSNSNFWVYFCPKKDLLNDLNKL